MQSVKTLYTQHHTKSQKIVGLLTHIQPGNGLGVYQTMSGAKMEHSLLLLCNSTQDFHKHPIIVLTTQYSNNHSNAAHSRC